MKVKIWEWKRNPRFAVGQPFDAEYPNAEKKLTATC